MSREHRYFVTGAAGFVGANLCHRLVERGEQVHVLLKPATPTWRLDAIKDRIHAHSADITVAAEVERVVDEVRPSVIYHLATHGAYHYQDDTEAILRINVLGLWNLVRACDRVGYDLLINTGSSSEYGEKAFAMRETDLPDPKSFYAVAKAAQSLLCQHLGRATKSNIVTLRLFSVYGAWEEPRRLIPTLMLAALRDSPIEMVSPQTVRDLIHIDDVVDIYMEVEKLAPLRGEILNIGSGVQTSMAQLIDAMSRVNDKPIAARWGAMPARGWDSNVWVADVSKVRRMTGWIPRVDIHEGLRRSLDWFRRHRGPYDDPSLPPSA